MALRRAQFERRGSVSAGLVIDPDVEQEPHDKMTTQHHNTNHTAPSPTNANHPCAMKGSLYPIPETLSDPSIIDLRILVVRLNGDQGKTEKYVMRFIESVTKGLAEMDDALLQQYIIMIKKIAHRVKSFAGTVGALGFSDLCQPLDKDEVTELTTTVVQQIQALHDRFALILDRLSIMNRE